MQVLLFLGRGEDFVHNFVTTKNQSAESLLIGLNKVLLICCLMLTKLN